MMRSIGKRGFALLLAVMLLLALAVPAFAEETAQAQPGAEVETAEPQARGDLRLPQGQ